MAFRSRLYSAPSIPILPIDIANALSLVEKGSASDLAKVAELQLLYNEISGKKQSALTFENFLALAKVLIQSPEGPESPENSAATLCFQSLKNLFGNQKLAILKVLTTKYKMELTPDLFNNVMEFINPLLKMRPDLLEDLLRRVGESKLTDPDKLRSTIKLQILADQFEDNNEKYLEWKRERRASLFFMQRRMDVTENKDHIATLQSEMKDRKSLLHEMSVFYHENDKTREKKTDKPGVLHQESKEKAETCRIEVMPSIPPSKMPLDWLQDVKDDGTLDIPDRKEIEASLRTVVAKGGKKFDRIKKEELQTLLGTEKPKHGLYYLADEKEGKITTYYIGHKFPKGSLKALESDGKWYLTKMNSIKLENMHDDEEYQQLTIAGIAKGRVVRYGKKGKQLQEEMVIDYIPGRDLDYEFGHYDNPKNITLPMCVDIVLGMLEALDSLHKQDKIHRDLSLNNFVRNKKTGEIKLIDHQFVMLLPAKKDEVTAKAIGTPGYLDKSIISAIEYSKPDKMFITHSCVFSKKTDMYAIGVDIARVLNLITHESLTSICFEPMSVAIFNSLKLVDEKSKQFLKNPMMANRELATGILNFVARLMSERASDRPLTPECIKFFKSIKLRLKNEIFAKILVLNIDDFYAHPENQFKLVTIAKKFNIVMFCESKHHTAKQYSQILDKFECEENLVSSYKCYFPNKNPRDLAQVIQQHLAQQEPGKKFDVTYWLGRDFKQTLTAAAPTKPKFHP